MSNSDEKIMILKMLEQGTINSEEAANLLEALESSTKKETFDIPNKNQSKHKSFQEEANKIRDKVNSFRKDVKNNYNQKDFDKMIDEFSIKAEKLGKNLAHTTVGIVDKVVDFVGSFVETNTFNAFGNYTAVNKTFEATAFDGINIKITGINGQIVLKKHLEDKILIRSRIKSPSTTLDSILIFSKTDEGIELSVNNTTSMNLSISHEILVPEKRLGQIHLITSNARIYCEDAISDSFECLTRNSHIELMGIKSDRINLSTKNARIQLSYITGKDISIHTNNSLIDMKHIKAEKITAVTTNGKITVENSQNPDHCELVEMVLMTTNGSIKVNMNDMDNRVYKIKAQTAHGGINLLIPDLSYNNIGNNGIAGNVIEAVSNNFDTYPQKVSINANTVNGFIEVVK